MNLAAKFRAWRAKRANDKQGKVTSGRTSQGERDRTFKEEKKK